MVNSLGEFDGGGSYLGGCEVHVGSIPWIQALKSCLNQPALSGAEDFVSSACR
jgi:hypothetical protein